MNKNLICALSAFALGIGSLSGTAVADPGNGNGFGHCNSNGNGHGADPTTPGHTAYDAGCSTAGPPPVTEPPPVTGPPPVTQTPPPPPPVEDVVPVVTPPVVISAPPAPTPVATVANTVTVVKKCVSRRSFAIRLRSPNGEKLANGTVYVNGKLVKVVKRDRLRSAVNLVGLPKGGYSVTIVVTTVSGKVFKGTRKYRTCAPKGKGGTPKV